MTNELDRVAATNFRAYDDLVDAVYLVDIHDASILHVNRNGADRLQMTPEEVCELGVLGLQRDVFNIEHWHKIIEAARTEPPFIFWGRHVRKDGSEFPVEVMSQLVCWEGKEYLLSTARDMTSRQAMEEDLRNREPLLAFALNEAMDGMWDWNAETGEVFFSPGMKRMLGYGPYEMPPVFETWKDNVHPDDCEQVLQLLDDHLQGKSERYEATYRLANRNGDYLWMSDSGQVCQKDSQGNPLRVVGMLRNIDQQKRLEDRLRDLATVDELTGLMNRRAGYSAFEQQVRLAKRHVTGLSVALLDLDYFKAVNDQYGHQMGDKVLKMAANCFSQRLRGTDILMRWGGEEFLLVMPHTQHQDALLLCEELRDQLSKQVLYQSDQAISVTVSIGLAVLTADSHSIKQLVQEADTALYRAKSLGKNRCVAF